MIGGMGSATERTPTARTTARGKATTPANESSCVEISTNTTVISTNTCRRGDFGRTPDTEDGAGRKVKIDSNRTQTTRVRVGVGATHRSSRDRRGQDTDPGPGGYANTFHQPYTNDLGASWIWGRLPEQQRTMPPGHGPGPDVHANTFPGGRGHDRYHHLGGHGRGRGEGFGEVPPPDIPSSSPPNVSPNLRPG